MTRLIVQEQREPASCTVELVTGSFVHLACPPSRVAVAREEYAHRVLDMAGTQSPVCRFDRQTGPQTGWAEVWIDVTQVVGIYALNARPEPPMVYSVLAAGGVVPQGV